MSAIFFGNILNSILSFRAKCYSKPFVILSPSVILSAAKNLSPFVILSPPVILKLALSLPKGAAKNLSPFVILTLLSF